MELLKGRENAKLKYKQEKDKLLNKKEKLWKLMDFTKWEIIDEGGKIDSTKLLRDKVYAFQNMCTLDNKSLDNIHKQLGYANKMTIDELKRMMEVC